VELKDVREKQMLTRSGYLRAYGGYIPLAAFRERRHFFAAKVRPLPTAVHVWATKPCSARRRELRWY